MADHVAAASEAAPSEPGAPLPPVGLVFDEDCQLHAPPERFNGKPAIEHAERPERTEVIWAAVVKAGLDRQCERLAPREATREEALTCHSCEHVEALDALEHEQPATRRRPPSSSPSPNNHADPIPSKRLKILVDHVTNSN